MQDNRITLRTGHARPSAEILEQLSGAGSGDLCDAAGGLGALPPNIRPVTVTSNFIGSALTVRLSPGDHLALWAALEVAQPGDVLVVATAGHLGCAVMGDLMGGFAHNAGVGAVVTDGALRDAAGLSELGLICFAAGLSPVRPRREGPGAVGVPVEIGGLAIEPGDLVAGDGDGVVVLPQALLPAVVMALGEIRRREQETRAAIGSGARTTSAIRTLLRQRGLSPDPKAD